LDNPQVIKRFLHEVKAAAKLDHPNIVKVYDANQVRGNYYLAMEFIPGIDLARWIQEQGQAPLHEACDYILQAALGLEHAHERGLVHRDIKPSNLMRTADGQTIKILDLGLALKSSGTTLTSQDHTRLGTVDYMAPEQVRNAHKVDKRADLYSLGCTLYHFLAGRPPFADAHPEARPIFHVGQQPPPVESFRADLPATLCAVVRRMMAKQPQNRYQTAGEVAAALAPFTESLKAEPAAPMTTDVDLRPRRPEAESDASYQHPARVPKGTDAKKGSVNSSLRREISVDKRRWLALIGLAVSVVGGGLGVTVLLNKTPNSESASGSNQGSEVKQSKNDTDREAAQNWFQRGNELLRNKEYDQAITAYTKAIRFNANHAEAYYNRARAHAGKGDTISQEIDHRTALSLKPALREDQN
jgi:serine/threonine protein kinase